MNKVNKVLSAIPLVIILALFLFFGLKGCVVDLWSYPKENMKYEIKGEDGRSLAIYFTTKGRTIFHFYDTNNSEEIVSTKMRSSFGTHYIGPLWHIGGEDILGFRWIKDDMKPINMETEILKKYMRGRVDSNFPPVGKVVNIDLNISEDLIIFQNMPLERSVFHPDQLQRLEALTE